MLLRILTFFKWVYGNPLTFLVGIRRIPAYHVDYTTVCNTCCSIDSVRNYSESLCARAGLAEVTDCFSDSEYYQDNQCEVMTF